MRVGHLFEFANTNISGHFSLGKSSNDDLT